MAQERGNTKIRTADRYAGIPLLALLGLFHRKRPMPQRIRTIGLLMFGAIGDALLSGAMIKAISAANPDACITIFVSRANRQVFELLSGFDESVVIPITNPWTAIRMMRVHSFDIVIDFGSWFRMTALLAAATPAHHSVGFRTAGQYRHYAFDTTVEHSDRGHEIDNYRRLAQTVGAVSLERPRITIPAIARERIAAEKLEDYVVFHPWASGFRSEMREWPLDRWTALGRRLTDMGHTVVTTGGDSDAMKASELVHSIGRSSISLAGQLRLSETAALLEGASLLVTVNTGIMHIGAAVDVPMIALHGPTNPRRWGPLADTAIVLGGDGPDCGYLHLGFEYPADPPACMERITVDRVIDSVHKLLTMATT
ncbi:MAG: glycosyl transferase family 9 [Rhodospirillales bacterium]|nr:glycosyl transferase family 9 [Rhodospirillales bacterium]